MDGNCYRFAHGSCICALIVISTFGISSQATAGVGACCLPDGSCTEDLAECQDGGGVNHPSETCSTFECPPAGACCLPDGECVERFQDECGDAGGIFHGDDSDCANFSCIGACCFSTSPCIETDEVSCTSNSGTFLGEGSTCSDCPIGACCYSFQQCEVITEGDCFFPGGSAYLGDGSTCSDCPTGACCFQDQVCREITEAECFELKGTYQGDGSICSDCPMGACCFRDQECEIISEGECFVLNGTYQGDSSPCSFCPTGACCFQDRPCEVTNEGDCFSLNGSYQGDRSICSDCPMGACCFPDQQCQLTTEGDCFSQNGTYQGDASSCALCPTGACCVNQSSCHDNVTEDYCTNFLFGIYMGDGNLCEDQPCPFGACCVCSGDCIGNVTESQCLTFDGGVYQSDGSTCDSFPCPPSGACCFSDGNCLIRTEACCNNISGLYLGDDSDCKTICPFGACCISNGECLPGQTQTECDNRGGNYQGDGVVCDTTIANGTVCPIAGACCLPDGSCALKTMSECDAANGVYQGDVTDCITTICPCDRVSSTEKGSILIYPKVDLRFNAAGFLVQDTFIDITNDHPEDVDVQMYFVNGDTWLYLDNHIQLTGNEPTYWSAFSGLPKGVSPFTALGPAIVDPDGSSDTVIRGYIVAFAVTNLGEEIRWNHLKGDAAIVNYRDGTAWEYNTYAFQAVTGLNGDQTGDPGELHLNGFEFAYPYAQLLMDFYSVGSSGLSGPSTMVTVNPDLTLLPVKADFRQEGDGPVTTKAKFLIWNQNEVKFSELHRCITCWDQALLANYDTPNHFLLQNLHTNKGKARIDGVESQVCDFDAEPDDGACGNHPLDVCSETVPLLGVRALFMPIGTSGTVHAASGINLVGMGKEATVIYFDPQTPEPPESKEPETTEPESTSDDSGKTWFKAIDTQIQKSKKRSR